MRRVVLTCILSLVATNAWAQKGEEEEDDEEEEEEDEEEAATPAPKAEPKQASKGKADEFQKQDLRGHAVDAKAIENPFQKDRFFVDKVDTEKTEKGTLVQGSLQLSSFLYRESAGNLPAVAGGMSPGSAAGAGRLFGDLRSQTDFRHIGGSRWDGRFDLRGRYVTDPASASIQSADPNRIQSGFNGTNELEVREAWFARSGKRTDLFFGRQFVPDLGAIKIDGLRFDYASSEKTTFLGFAGFYPLRGSRSITTDYPKLRTSDGTDDLTGAGKLVTAGGFGAAYRTINMHGALGGVAIVPLSSERPRIYATANGYYRAGTQVDFYHYAILDVFGAAADPVALTNLSAGVNYKPGQRLRLTASFNRVDTETLNVQAGSFLDTTTVTTAMDPVTGAAVGGTKVQNETFIQLQRISTNSARGSLSVGLGSLNRFEITIASAFRYRPGITLRPGTGDPIELDPAKAIDVFGGIMDRRSFLDLRIGVDASRTIAVGDISFNRAEALTLRAFASREIGKGRGEWEGEVSYATSRDRSGETTVACTGDISPASCFGLSNTTVYSVGGQVYYRVKKDVFAIGNLYVSRMALQRKDADMTVDDPNITSVTAFARLAYRY
jgi:hypothetical protein